MNLSDYFHKNSIVQDGVFVKTMYPGTLEQNSICYATKRVYLQAALGNPNISAVITTAELAPLVDGARGLVVVENPQLAFYQLHNYLVEHRAMAVHTEHSVHPTAQLAETALVGAYVLIGEGVVVEHRAIIGNYTVIGANTYVGENVVVGCKGLQDTSVEGVSFPLRYAGGVRIGRGCEILAGTLVQKPYQAFYTEIGDEAKISVKVIVGHGVRIGRGTMVAGNAQIAGNVRIGEKVWIGPSVAISDAISIGDGAQVKIGSVVVQNVEPYGEVSGNFAVDHRRQLRLYGRIKRGQL